MDGGKLISSGSDSCIFIPNLPCSNNSIIDKKKISKIMYNPSAQLDSQHEKRMNERIKKIKGYEKWAIIFEGLKSSKNFLTEGTGMNSRGVGGYLQFRSRTLRLVFKLFLKICFLIDQFENLC